MSGFVCPDGKLRVIIPCEYQVEEPNFGPAEAFPMQRGWHIMLGMTCSEGSYYNTYNVVAPDSGDPDGKLMNWSACLHGVLAYMQSQGPRPSDTIVTQVMIRRHRIKVTTLKNPKPPAGTPEAQFSDLGETVAPAPFVEPEREKPAQQKPLIDGWIPNDMV